MNQFDVFQSDNRDLYCILQSDLLDGLDTVTTALLIPADKMLASRMTPTVTVNNRKYRIDIPRQIPMRISVLHQASPTVSVIDSRDDIMDAINLLYWGI